MRKVAKLLAVVLVGAVLMMSGCDGSASIKLVHKNYTEERLIGQVMYLYLLDKGYDVSISELGGTMLCFNALVEGDADMYPEYTGSAYSAVFNQIEIMSVEETYEYVSRRFKDEYDVTWFAPFGFNDTYVLSVTKETMDKYNIHTISDLVEYSAGFKLGCDSEFPNRADGYLGLKEHYKGLDFGEVISMDQGLTYNALVDGSIDVNMSYSTDGRIAKYNLQNLEDDKQFFPSYYVCPIVRDDCLEKHPNLKTDLEALGNLWTEEEMQQYNLMVDEGTDIKEVATMMLRDKGLIK